ncbi:MAG: hypothetical protein HYV07_12430 [Deltaproteobacteria bacterium]|nr:hypothetical protein [Deltaproteobacteria bacterium]
MRPNPVQQSAESTLRELFDVSRKIGADCEARNRARNERIAEDTKAIGLARGEAEASSRRLEAIQSVAAGVWSMLGGIVTVAGVSTQGVGAGSSALEQASFLESLALCGSLNDALEVPAPASVFGEGKRLGDLVPAYRVAEALEKGELLELAQQLLVERRDAVREPAPLDPFDLGCRLFQELGPKAVDAGLDVFSKTAEFGRRDATDLETLRGQREDEWSQGRAEVEAEAAHETLVERLERDLTSRASRTRVAV